MTDLAEELKTAIDDAVQLSVVLGEDVVFATKGLTFDSDQEARRAYVWSVFAFVEGMTHAFKRALAKHRVHGSLFTDGDLAVLVGVGYDLDDKGQPVERPQFVRFAANVRFAITPVQIRRTSE